MKIGVYYRSFAFHGGGPRVALGIAKSLAQLGHQPVILTNEYDLAIWPELKAWEIVCAKFSPLARISFREIGYVPGTVSLLMENMRRLDALFLTGMYLISPVVKIFSCKPLILYVHCVVSWDWTVDRVIRHVVREIEKRTYRFADYVLCNSMLTHRVLKTYLELDSEILYPPIDTEYLTPVKEKEDDLIVSVCRLDPKKESEEMIKIFQNSIFDKYRFVLAGNVDKHHRQYAKTLKQLADKDSRISVIFNPSYEEIRNLYQKAAVFWYIYPREDFGIPLAEAMSCGTPVVAMRGGGVNEIVTRETGFLAGSNDEFIRFTRVLLENPEKRSHMGVAATKLVKTRFSHNAFTTKLQAILNKTFDGQETEV